MIMEPGIKRLGCEGKAPVKWLWPYRLPIARSVLLEGDLGLGKRLVALDLAARVSTGRPWPNAHQRREPGDVILLTAANGIADVVLPRLRAAGAELARVHPVC